MEKTLRMSLLFDFYGSLLTDRQQDVFQMYFHEDFSLGEIGDELKVTRQAVYDILKRVAGILEEFEMKLNLVQKHQERQHLLVEVLDIVESTQPENLTAIHLSTIAEKIHKVRATS